MGVAPKSRVNFKLVGPQPVQSAIWTQVIRAHNNEIEEFLQENMRGICSVSVALSEDILSIIATFHINTTDYTGHILVYAQYFSGLIYST